MLTPESRGRLHEELSALEIERRRLMDVAANTVGKDPADQAERTLREFDVEQVEIRIQRLRDRLDAADRPAHVAPLDGTVRSGVLVSLDFGDGAPERYVVGGLAEVDEDVDVVTPSSPLGRALLGSSAGDTVSYRTPQGERSVRVTAIDALPDGAVGAGSGR